MSTKLKELTRLRLVPSHKSQEAFVEGSQWFEGNENSLISYCENCCGTGWQRKSYIDGSYKIIKCIDDSHLTEKLLNIGVPDSQLHYSLSTYLPENQKQQQAKEVAESFIDSFVSTGQEQKPNRTKGLILTGHQQTGKTHLAVAIVKALLAESKLSIKYGNFFDEIFGLLCAQDCFDLEPKGYPLPISKEADLERKRFVFLYNQVLNIDLLVLDDLNIDISYLELNVLSHIIAYRYNKYLPVIITSGLSLAEMESCVSSGIYIKLIDMCELVSLS